MDYLPQSDDLFASSYMGHSELAKSLTFKDRQVAGLLVMFRA